MCEYNVCMCIGAYGIKNSNLRMEIPFCYYFIKHIRNGWKSNIQHPPLAL